MDTKTPPEAMSVSALVLEPILGPATPAIHLPGFGPRGDTVSSVTVGRLPDCQMQVPESEKTVSRRHCSFVPGMNAWEVVDLGSRHGTFVNDQQLAANTPRPIKAGDMIRFGPWTFSAGSGKTASVRTLDDTATQTSRVVAGSRLSQEALDRRRLALLLKCAKQIQQAQDEFRLALFVLDALLEGTGYPRAAVVRTVAADANGLDAKSAERIEVLATKATGGGRPTTTFSRSLLQAAAKGQIAELKPDDIVMGAAVSIMSSGTAVALAVPVMLDGKAAMTFYLDARREETTPHDDSPAFCQAIAEMCSLSVASMERQRLEGERLRFTEQMEAGMAIQRLILPKPKGTCGGVKYSLDLRPGRFVAGDLFDIIKLDDRRVAFFIGDVSGKGLPAAILMATTQSYLNAALTMIPDPAKVADAVNKHLIDHAPENKFVSLWLGVLDTLTGLLQYVDAGHGYWLLREPGEAPESVRLGQGGGAPLRVIEGIPYRTDEIVLSVGARIVLYSDGVVEQLSRDGEPFGDDRVIASIAHAASAEQDVDSLVRAVMQHAGGDALADDLTVASIHYHSNH